MAGFAEKLYTNRLFRRNFLKKHKYREQNEEKKSLLTNEVQSRIRHIMRRPCIPCGSPSGNNGPKPGSISALGKSEYTVAVGCHDGMDYPDRKGSCEDYSGRGPSEFVMKKPDLVAPGSNIVSCNAACGKSGVGKTKSYIGKNGTSMATPIVSGAVALCMQKFPEDTNEQIKRRLLWSCEDLKEPWNKQGWGMLHVRRMLYGN